MYRAVCLSGNDSAEPARGVSSPSQWCEGHTGSAYVGVGGGGVVDVFFGGRALFWGVKAMQAPSSVFLLVKKKKTSGALLSSSWKSGLEFTWNVPLRVRLSSCTTFDCADCADSLPRQKQMTQALFESHEDPAEGAIYRWGVGVAPGLRLLVRHFRHCFGTTFFLFFPHADLSAAPPHTRRCET